MSDGAANPETPSRRKGVLLVVAIFALGIVCGAATTFVAARIAGPPLGGPPMRPRGGIERLANELDLDADQRARVEEILERHREDLEGLHDRVGEELRSVLTEDQRARFEQVRRRMHGPGGPSRRRHPHPPPR